MDDKAPPQRRESMPDEQYARRLGICLRGITRGCGEQAAYIEARQRAYGIAKGGYGEPFDKRFYKVAKADIAEYVGIGKTSHA